MVAPISRPPFDRPEIARCAGAVIFSRISHSAAPMKSSKTFCLLREHAGLVPGLAVLAAAAQVRDRVDAAVLQERRDLRLPVRQDVDVEAAVAVEQRRVAAVARERAAFVHEEQRALRAVARGVAHLLDLECVRVERRGDLAPYRGLRGRGALARPSTCSRRIIVGVRNDVKDRNSSSPSRSLLSEATLPRPGQRQLALRFAVDGKEANARRGVLEIERGDLPTQHGGALEDLLALRQDLFPLRTLRVAQVGGEHAAARRVLVAADTRGAGTGQKPGLRAAQMPFRNQERGQERTARPRGEAGCRAAPRTWRR